MITSHQGDLLTSSCTFLCHQANCLGSMGAGIAKQIASQFPNVLREYTNLCHSISNPSALLGSVQYCKISSRQFIVNVFGQIKYGQGSCQTDYAALKKAFTTIHDRAAKEHSSVAIPHLLGCGLAGGDWNIVFGMLKELFDGPDEPLLEIWSLR